VTGDRSPRPGDRRRAARRPAARRGPCSLALLAIVLRTTGRRARQVWLGCKRCALSGTDHRDPRTEEGCPVTETRTGLPAAVSSGYPDRIAGGYFVRVAGQDCRRQFRSGYTMTVQRLARSRPNGGRATPQQSHGAERPFLGFRPHARQKFKTTPSPRDVVTGSRSGLSAARRSCGDPLYASRQYVTRGEIHRGRQLHRREATPAALRGRCESRSRRPFA
jgi:hypothetical protein